MDIKLKLYEIEVDLRIAFQQINDSASPQDMANLFISICSTIITTNQLIVEQDDSYDLACLFYQSKEPTYHPLAEQLYSEYFTKLNSEPVDQAYLDSEFNSCLQ